MNVLNFYKYQATGNDFIMINALHDEHFILNKEDILRICDRKFGVGADGLIILRSSAKSDFYMDYYNADGSQSFCGNGARSAVKFFIKVAESKKNTFVFEAIDGQHSAELIDELVSLEMFLYGDIMKDGKSFVLQTGSPHYVTKVDNLAIENIVAYGKSIRYSDTYKISGINVNLFKESKTDELEILTYERGVENETLSCGTGITATALAYVSLSERFGKHEIQVKSRGGNLIVTFNRKENNIFQDIRLIGPADEVFYGEITI